VSDKQQQDSLAIAHAGFEQHALSAQPSGINQQTQHGGSSSGPQRLVEDPKTALQAACVSLTASARSVVDAFHCYLTHQDGERSHVQISC
jgi:hypothetical protein